MQHNKTNKVLALLLLVSVAFSQLERTNAVVMPESNESNRDTIPSNETQIQYEAGFDKLVDSEELPIDSRERPMEPMEVGLEIGKSGEDAHFLSDRVGIGTASPGAKLDVAGQIKITGGSPGANKVLTSDASGLASWETQNGPRVRAITITVGGDSDKYYPVYWKGTDQNVVKTIQIYRAYSWPAPDDWNTPTHKGGLNLEITTNFGGWGGMSYGIQTHFWEETYSTIVGGMRLGASYQAFVVWLRGGGARYDIFCEEFDLGTPTIVYTDTDIHSPPTYTDVVGPLSSPDPSITPNKYRAISPYGAIRAENNGNHWFSSGNVGIGTTSPGAKLDVNGDILLQYGVKADAIRDEDNMTSNDADALATQQSIKAYVDAQVGATTDDQTLNEVYNEGGNVVTLDATGDIQFQNDETTPVQMLFLDESSGNVGIGTTSPSNRLEVSGEASYSAVGDMGTGNADFAHKEYVDNAVIAASEDNQTLAEVLIEGNTAGANDILMQSNYILFDDTDYNGLYFGEAYQDANAHSSDWGYVRHNASNGQLEIGSDANIDFYETDGRLLQASFNLNTPTFDFYGRTSSDGLTNDGTLDQNGTADFSTTVDIHGTLDMNNGLISTGYFSATPSRYWSSSVYGINLNNSDIIGLNWIYWGDLGEGMQWSSDGSATSNYGQIYVQEGAPYDMILDPYSTTASVNVSGAKVTNMGTPTVPSDATTKAYVDGLIGGGVGTGTNGQTLRHNGTSWIANSTLYNNGTNIGIGTTTPGQSLDISRGHSDTRARLYYDGGGLADRVSSLSLWASEPGVTYYGSGIGHNIDGSYRGVTYRLETTYGASYIRFLRDEMRFGIISAAGVDAVPFMIANTGNVGVGTTLPGSKLDVAGSIRTNSQFISTVGTGTSPLAVSSQTVVSNLNADLLDGLHASNFERRYNESFSVGSAGWYRVAHIDGASGRGNMEVSIYTTGGSYTPRTTTIRFFHDWSSTAGLSIISEVGGGYWSQARITDDGSNSYLEVYFTGSVDGNLVLQNEGGYDRGTLYSGSLPAGGSTVRATTDLGLLNVGTGKFFVRDNGNVGVGETSPGAKLDVNGDILLQYGVKADAIRDEDNMASNDADALATQQSIKAYVDAQVGSITGDNLGNHTATENLKMSGSWVSNDGGDEGIFVATDGDVGIGTNSPDMQLDVNGSVQIQDVLRGGNWRHVLSDGFNSTASNGYLLTTSIPYDGTTQRGMHSVRIIGYAYGNQDPIDFVINFYLYTSGLSSYGWTNYGAYDPGTVKLSYEGGYVKIWWSTTVYYPSYEVFTTSWIGSVDTDAHFEGWDITDAAAPSTNVVDVPYKNAEPQGLTMGGNIALTGNFLSGDGGSEGVYVDNSGNVGIGETSPGAKLDVNGDILLQYGVNADAIRDEDNMASNDADALATQQSIKAYVDAQVGATTDDQTLNEVYNEGGNVVTLDATGDIQFQNDETTPVQMLFLDESSGNVGIGTTSPGYKLDVNGVIRNNNNIYFGSNTPGGSDELSTEFNDGIIVYTPVSGDRLVSIEVDNEDILTATQSGNVGVGTTSPDAKLHSVSSYSGTGSALTNASIAGVNDNDDSDNPDGIGVYGECSTDYGYAGYFNGDLRVTGKYLDSSGDAGSSGQILSSTGSGTNWIAAPSLPSGSSGQTLRHNGTSWIANSTLYNNGTNVGIETTSPLSKLSINGSGSSNYGMFIEGPSTNVDNQAALYIHSNPFSSDPPDTYNKYYGIYVNQEPATSAVYHPSAIYGNMANVTTAYSTGVLGRSIGTGTDGGRTYGVKGYAGGGTSRYNYAVYGELQDVGGRQGTAILGYDAIDNSWDGTLQAGNYAGYFVGDVHITGNLTGGGLSSSNWTLSGTDLYPNSTTYDVGIGATNPSTKLEIRNNSSTTTSNTNTFSDFGLVIHNDNATENAFAGIAFKSNTTDPSADTDRIGAAIKAVRHEDNSSTSYDRTDLRFCVNNYYSDDLFERMTIKYDGNVGIGTTSPTYKLDVDGTGRFTGTLYANSDIYAGNDIYIGSTDYIGLSASDGRFVFFNNTSLSYDRISLQGGHLGIGTDYPYSPLAVNGSGAFDQQIYAEASAIGSYGVYAINSYTGAEERGALGYNSAGVIGETYTSSTNYTEGKLGYSSIGATGEHKEALTDYSRGRLGYDNRGVDAYSRNPDDATSTGSQYGGYFEGRNYSDYSGTTNGYGIYAYGYGLAAAGTEYTYGVYGYGLGGRTGSYGGYFQGGHARMRPDGSGYNETFGVYSAGNFASSGTKSAIVRTEEGPKALYCQESPENWFEDVGKSKIAGGKAVVSVAKDFMQTVTINDEYPMNVFITPNADLGGRWWVEEKHDEFVLHAPEAPDGAGFTYRIIAKRKDFEELRMPVISNAWTDHFLYPNVEDIPQEHRNAWVATLPMEEWVNYMQYLSEGQKAEYEEHMRIEEQVVKDRERRRKEDEERKASNQK